MPGATADGDGNRAIKEPAAERGGQGDVACANEFVVGVKNQVVAGEGRPVVNFHVHEIFGEIQEACENPVDEHRGEDQSPQRRFTLFGRVLRGFVTVDGNHIDEAGAFFIVLKQDEVTGDRGFAGADRAKDGFTADGIAAGVEAPARTVDRKRIEELGDVEIGRVA